MMTNPCQIGLKCPYRRCSEEGDSICVYPYGVIVPEDETFGIIEVVDCPLVEPDELLEDFLFRYAEFNGRIMFIEGERFPVQRKSMIDEIERRADRNDPF